MKNILAILFLTLFATGCASTGAKLGPVNLDAPGWTLRQGQAVWRPDGKKPEITGDVVLATHADGTAYLAFSKTLPLVTARRAPGAWAIDFHPEDRSYSGSGDGPKRIVWLQLLKAIEGRPVSKRWQLSNPNKSYYALDNPESGERLEITLTQ